MNLPAQISVSRASLPRTYEAAQAALAECSQVDECKDWADKAAALASYARQSEDQELERMAQRIRARAIRRAGELLKQIEPQQGARYDLGSQAAPSRKDVARDAGMSDRQQKTALRVANIPPQEFERQVESAKPPTLSQLAQQGVKPRENIVDLQGRDPKEYNRALHYVADFEGAAKELESQSHDLILPTLDEKERARLRAAIQRIDAITDKVATRI
jgi:AraC-like DNA-binding protein